MGTVYSFFFETSSETTTAPTDTSTPSGPASTQTTTGTDGTPTTSADTSTPSAPATTQAPSENAPTLSSGASSPAQAQPAVQGGYSIPYTPDRQHSYCRSASEEDEDKRNIIVKNCGKSQQVDVFPGERTSKLKQEACQLFAKKEQKMKLVYQGEELDITKTIRELNLRAGCTVNLITAA